jgi:hypothetical protein
VLALAIGATVACLAGNYQPLRADPGGAPIFVRSAGGDLRRIFAITPKDARSFTAYDVPYHAGLGFSYGFMLVNDGPVDVTVLHIGVLGGDPIRTLAVKMELGEGGRGVRGTATLPFARFSLPAHTGNFIAIEGRFAGCSMSDEAGAASAAYITVVPVEFQVLGLTKHAYVPLPYSLRISGNDGCPKA